jgi:pilus assembly protein CpaB
MRAKNAVGLVFVLTAGVGAFALLNNMHKGDANVPQQQVIASTVELSAGTLLRAQDITWQPVSAIEPGQIVRPGAAQIQAKPDLVEETAAGLYGAALRHTLALGIPIRRSDIVKPGDRDFLQVVLTPGARAIAIPVTAGGASTGLLTPGDRVDVILTQNFSHDGTPDARSTPITRKSVGETIVQNLRVLAINMPETKPGSNSAANGNFGRTVTLEVTSEEAETLNVAQELGKLSVTLRSSNTTAPSVADELLIRPKWAGDVSPALFGAAQPKPRAIKERPIMVLRGGKPKELIQPETPDETK